MATLCGIAESEFFMIEIGNRIKLLRKKHKLSQNDLGDIAGLHGSNIGRIEKGTVLPTAEVLLKIAKYFNVTSDWLLTGQESDAVLTAREASLIDAFRLLDDQDKHEVLMLLSIKMKKYF